VLWRMLSPEKGKGRDRYLPAPHALNVGEGGGDVSRSSELSILAIKKVGGEAKNLPFCSIISIHQGTEDTFLFLQR